MIRTSLHQNFLFMTAMFKTCKPSWYLIILHTTRKYLRFWISCLGLLGSNKLKILLGSSSLGENVWCKSLLKGHLGKFPIYTTIPGGPFEKEYHQNIRRKDIRTPPPLSEVTNLWKYRSNKYCFVSPPTTFTNNDTVQKKQASSTQELYQTKTLFWGLQGMAAHFYSKSPFSFPVTCFMTDFLCTIDRRTSKGQSKPIHLPKLELSLCHQSQCSVAGVTSLLGT